MFKCLFSISINESIGVFIKEKAEVGSRGLFRLLIVPISRNFVDSPYLAHPTLQQGSQILSLPTELGQVALVLRYRV